MSQTLAYAAYKQGEHLKPYSFDRRDLRPNDVKIDILYCGVCHTDIHQVKNEWKNSIYPMVPGHEIVGRVVEVKDATDFKPGDLVAVGCLVDSCRSCSSCRQNLEQFCEKGMTLTYNSRDRVDQSVTYGGYSSMIVVDKDFVLRVPQGFSIQDLPRVAPLLCAGITTYSPLRHWKVGKDSKVGVVGLGGLGHMAIKIANALGAQVVVFTTSESKVKDALQLGAHEVVVSKNPVEFKKYANTLNFILDTVSASHNLDQYLELLVHDGTLCLVGAPDKPHPTPNFSSLIFKRLTLGGSLIGGIKETQEMLDFCAENNILSEIELIPIQKINEAYERMLKSDVKYRFVIDISSLNNK